VLNIIASKEQAQRAQWRDELFHPYGCERNDYNNRCDDRGHKPCASGVVPARVLNNITS
jgi:hypothetical protein